MTAATRFAIVLVAVCGPATVQCVADENSDKSIEVMRRAILARGNLKNAMLAATVHYSGKFFIVSTNKEVASGKVDKWLSPGMFKAVTTVHFVDRDAKMESGATPRALAGGR